MSTITLSLSDKEASVLHGLSGEQELSQQQVLRQALRLYQHVNGRLKKGEAMAFVDKDGNVVHQAIIGMGDPSTLAQQVASAQAEVATWPEGKLARVKLAGGDQP